MGTRPFFDGYLAHIPITQLLNGGKVCSRNILSVGREIVSIKCFENPSFELYYADGSIQLALSLKKGDRQSVAVSKNIRLPLNLNETVQIRYSF